MNWNYPPILPLECAGRNCTQLLHAWAEWSVRSLDRVWFWLVSVSYLELHFHLVCFLIMEEWFFLSPSLCNNYLSKCLHIVKPGAALGTLSVLDQHSGPLVMWSCVCAKSKYLTTVPAAIAQPLSDLALISWEFQGFESDWIKILFLQVDEDPWLTCACWFFKGLKCMYRLQSPGCHCLNGDCFLTKIGGKKRLGSRSVFCLLDAVIMLAGRCLCWY